MKLTIEIGNSNPILRAKSEAFLPSEYKNGIALGKEMVKWLKTKDNSAGLAAPQVGVNKRLIAVHLYDIRD